jgi:membrane fusion protein, multidrug efflux system
MLSKPTELPAQASFSTSEIAEARPPEEFQPAAVPAREIKANEAHKPNVLRRRVAAAIGALISAAALTGGYVYWGHIAHFECTDDAFVAARQFAVGPKVSGYIIGIPVTDNQHVGAGDVIAQIDQRFRLDCATGANPIVAVILYRCPFGR